MGSGVQITLTGDQLLLITLMIQNAISAITSQVSGMTDEQVEAAIATEKDIRNKQLMAEVDSH